MSDARAKNSAREISLGDDFGDVVIKVNGARVEISHEGVVTNKPGAANDATLKIGDLDDGGVYVGLSAENGKPLHAALADEPKYLTYQEALAAAEALKSQHPTAHVPTLKELDENLFINQFIGNLKDTFNTSYSYPGPVYRSSASYDYGYARVQLFDDGFQTNDSRYCRLPVRLVW